MERSQLANMRQSFFDEGILDEQFVKMEILQTGTHPDFIEDMVTLFYNDSAQLILKTEEALEETPIDFSKLDIRGHSFVGCCSSIGAKKVLNAYLELRECRRAQNEEGCRRAFQQLKQERATLKRKLDAYFELGRQIRDAESTSGPPSEE